MASNTSTGSSDSTSMDACPISRTRRIMEPTPPGPQ
jgi:hypothetical protein